MNILFIQPPLGEGRKKRPLKQRLFPWGFATVIKCVEDDGHDVQLLDIYANDLIREEVLEHLDEVKYDVACITGFSSINYVYIKWLTKEIRKRSTNKIVIGGMISDLHFPLLLEKGIADICVIGEGEKTSVDLFRRFKKIEDVNGIAFLKNKKIVKIPPQSLIKNLDTLPMPNFSLWNMDRYTRVKMYAHDQSTGFTSYNSFQDIRLKDLQPNMTFLAGRGCPYRCKFCARSYDHLRLKSVDHIIEEISFMRKQYGIKAAHFADELVLVNSKRIIELCKKMKALDIYWDCQGRVNTVNKNIYKRLIDAKCISVGLGIESGSNEILKKMQKGITREQSLVALKDAKKTGMHLKIQLMGCYPGENKNSISETVNLLKESKMPPRRLTWCTPLPGTEIYNDAINAGKIPDEEQYLYKLRYGYNSQDHIVLNVSGLSDMETARLLKWAHMMMNLNYLKLQTRKISNFRRMQYWILLKNTIARTLDYSNPRILQKWYKLKAKLGPMLTIKDHLKNLT
jgi:radical SAM superfamily enzyme YgiQ (UPF0313 family)